MSEFARLKELAGVSAEKLFEGANQKHLQAVADAIKNLSDPEEKAAVSKAIGVVFAEVSHSFNWSKWNKYIGV